MLVLSRRLGERIVLPSLNTTIQVVAVKSGAVRLGIEAPPDVTIHREEVHQRIAHWQAPQVPAADGKLLQLLKNRLRIADIGVSVLRAQVEAGRTEEARTTLDRLEEDLQMLQSRFEQELTSPLPAPQLPPAVAFARNETERSACSCG